MRDMPTHTDLHFTISTKASKDLFGGPVLTRPKEVGASRAGAALRAYWALSNLQSDLIPGISIGRIHVPAHKLADLNCLEEEGEPMPSALVATGDKERSVRHFLQVFTDRTALVLTEEDSALCTEGLELLRVLPIVLKMPGKLAMKMLDQPIDLTVQEEPGGFARLMYSITGRAEDAAPIHERRSQTGLDELVREAIGMALDDEIRTWGREISRLPWLGLFEGAPRTGIFGRDHPAPLAEVEGQPYATPAAIPQANFTLEQYQKAAAFTKLAWAYFVDRIASGAEEGIIQVSCAMPRQDRPDGRISIKASHFRIPGEQEAQACKRMRKAFQALLQHPAAPSGLWTMSGMGRVPQSRGKRQILRNYDIFQGQVTRDRPSAHDRLQAYALFKDIEID